MKKIYPLLLFIFLISCTHRPSPAPAGETKKTIRDTLHVPGKNKLELMAALRFDSISVIYESYKNLSHQYEYQLSFTEKSFRGEPVDHYWTLNIVDKKTGESVDSIMQPIYTFYKDEGEKMIVRSLIKENKKNSFTYTNGEYGDLVIADYNFDGREDFALKYNLGGSRGSYYSFFIQQEDQHFVEDRFLTDSMQFSPQVYKPDSLMLVSTGPCGAYWLCEEKYILDKKTGTWSKFSFKEIDLRE